MSLISWLNARAEVSRLTEELSTARESLRLSEGKRDAELTRHLKREDFLIAVITRQAKDYSPAPSSVEPKALPPIDPSVMSAREEAMRTYFLDSAESAGRTQQEGMAAFDEWKVSGKVPYQTSDTEN